VLFSALSLLSGGGNKPHEHVGWRLQHLIQQLQTLWRRFVTFVYSVRASHVTFNLIERVWKRSGILFSTL